MPVLDVIDTSAPDGQASQPGNSGELKFYQQGGGAGVTIGTNGSVTAPGGVIGGLTGAVTATSVSADTTDFTGVGVGGAANESTGRAVLVGGTVTVNSTRVTAASNIFLTHQVPGGTVGTPRISSRVAGVSFTITSSQLLDTSTCAYLIVEPT